MTESFVALPAPTSRTTTTPRISYEGDQVTLSYDHEATDGSRSACSLVFRNVLAIEFRVEAVCGEDDVVPSHLVRVRDEPGSSYLVSTLNKWEESVGWQDWNKEQGGRSRFREYTVFVEDLGCVVVIAAELTPVVVPSQGG
jgi:hypothetical protein